MTRRGSLRDRFNASRARLHEARERAADGADPAQADAQDPLDAGGTNFRQAHVPWAVDTAAAWSWRMLVIAAAVLAVLWVLNYLIVIVLPLLIAVFLAAFLGPVVNRLSRAGLPRGLTSFLTVVVAIVAIGLMFTFVGQQVSSGFGNMSKQIATGLGQVQDWLRTGPLHISDRQLQDALDSLQKTVSNMGQGHLLSTVGQVGTTVSHVVAGLFIVLFGTYFFLYDGASIWKWMVRLFPRAARQRADSSGRVAWRSLTQFVRATVIVAATDALGIAVGAWILGVPFPAAIGVLVFFGAFVPMVGAFISGTAAVLVALVALGLVKAVIMLGIVVLVQQIEAHVLQPFLMGRFVSVHPLGVIIAIGVGVLVAGIPGALIAVPFTAAANAVAQHLASYTRVGGSTLDPPGPAPGETPPASTAQEAPAALE